MFAISLFGCEKEECKKCEFSEFTNGTIKFEQLDVYCGDQEYFDQLEGSTDYYWNGDVLSIRQNIRCY